MQEETGLEFPSGRGERRGRSASRCDLRPRRLRVRREHLVRPVPLDPGGAPAPPPGRTARLPHATARSSSSAPDRGARLDAETLQRPQRGLASARLVGRDGVEFHLASRRPVPRCSASSGFDVESLVELYAPDDADDHPYYDAVSADWARKWPAEEIWVAAETRLIGVRARRRHRGVLVHGPAHRGGAARRRAGASAR